MAMRMLMGRIGPPILLVATWFITLAGGWSDIGRAIGGKSTTTSRPPNSRSIEGSVLTDGHDLGMPTRLVVQSDELLVLDRYRSQPVLALDRHSGRFLRSFGSEGDGPGEFRSPVALVARGPDVAVLDVGHNRITWLTSRPDSFVLLSTTQLQLESAATDFVLTPEGDYLVSGFLAEGRLARLGRDGTLLGYEGRPVSLDGLHRERQIEALQGTVRASPSGDHIVRTSRFASDIEVADARTLVTTLVRSPVGFGPKSGNYETRFGYLDAATFADGFLALYSGRTRRDYPERANYGSVVHEFGWDGRLRAEYRLDADVIAIAWSEEDRVLYAVRHEPMPQIVMYYGMR